MSFRCFYTPISSSLYLYHVLFLCNIIFLSLLIEDCYCRTLDFQDSSWQHLWKLNLYLLIANALFSHCAHWPCCHWAQLDFEFFRYIWGFNLISILTQGYFVNYRLCIMSWYFQSLTLIFTPTGVCASFFGGSNFFCWREPGLVLWWGQD